MTHILNIYIYKYEARLYIVRLPLTNICNVSLLTRCVQSNEPLAGFPSSLSVISLAKALYFFLMLATFSSYLQKREVVETEYSINPIEFMNKSYLL